MSAVEDLVSRYETESSSVNEMDVEDDEDVGVKRSETVSENRLDSQLRLVCEKHDLPYEDYCHTPSSVKRTLLSWLSNDMDNTQEEDVKLRDDVVCDGFDDSAVMIGTAPTNSDSVIILDPRKKSPVSKTGPSVNLFGNDNSLRVGSHAAANISPVGEMTNVFQKALSDVGRNKPESPTVHSLRQFALSRGYSSEEVDEVLEENPDVRLSTILSALHKNRLRRDEQKSQPMDIELPSGSSGNPCQTKSTLRDSSPKPGTSASTSSSAQSFCSVQCTSSNSKLNNNTKADGETATIPGHGYSCNNKDQNLPGSWSVNDDYDDSVFKYFKQLSKHFTEETAELSREDLLKNNAERQKILKEAYEKAKEENLKSQSQGTGGTEKEGKNDQPLTKQQKRKKRKKRRKKKSVAAVSTAEQGSAAEAASTADKEEDDMDESSEEAEGEAEDTRDVVVEEEEVQFVMMKSHAMDTGGYNRSPRPQSPQNAKKARQDNRAGRRLDLEGPTVPNTAGVMQQGKKFSVNDWTLNNSQQKFDGATASGSGCDGVRPRHPSGNTQSKQKNQNYINARQPYSRPQQQPSFEQYRTVAPAADFGKGRQPNRPSPKRGHCLRPIVIDGSNVAVAHGNQTVFSCRGIEIAINYFLKRGHKDVTAFVPRWRQGGQNHQIRPTVDREILNELEKKGRVAFTPSRYINGRKYTSYDDRFIVELAAENDGVIVSNDNFRDLVHAKPKWTSVIQERLLMFTFAGDHFMVPDDPLGPRGPSLDQLLQKPADPIDYGFDRTDGAPAGPDPTFFQMPPQVPFQPMQVVNPRMTAAVNPIMQRQVGLGQPRPQPAQQPLGQGQPGQQQTPHKQHPPRQRAPESLTHPPRSQEETENLSTQLLSIFPDKSQMVERILTNHSSETDLNKLSAYILDAMI